MYSPRLTVPPVETPVSLAEVKAHLRVEDAAEDDLINGLINAAVAYLDGYSGILGRCLVSQTWELKADRLTKEIRLPLEPVTAITSVSVETAAGATNDIDAANYDLLADGGGSYIRFKNNFAIPADIAEVQPVTFTFVAGYGAAVLVPASIKSAILLMVGHLYEHRESVVTGTIATELPMSANALLAPYRRTGF